MGRVLEQKGHSAKMKKGTLPWNRKCVSTLTHDYLRSPLGLGTAYRNRTAVYRGTLLHTAVRTTVYRNSIKLTVIVNLSAPMGTHLIYMPTSHGV